MAGCSYRSIGLATDSIGNTFRVVMQDTFHMQHQCVYRRYFSFIFWQYLIPILLSSGSLVNSVNNNTTVPKGVNLEL